MKQPASHPLTSKVALQGEMYAGCIEALCLRRGTCLAVDLSLLTLITSIGLFGRRGSVACPPRTDGSNERLTCWASVSIFHEQFAHPVPVVWPTRTLRSVNPTLRFFGAQSSALLRGASIHPPRAEVEDTPSLCEPCRGHIVADPPWAGLALFRRHPPIQPKESRPRHFQKERISIESRPRVAGRA
jgi:hypothetical protein